MSSHSPSYQLVEEASQRLIDWARTCGAESKTAFETARQLVTRLGAHYREGRAEIGFWVPVLAEQNIPAERIFLEILTPLAPIDFQADQQQLSFRRRRLSLVPDGEYLWGVIEGMQPGSRDQVGDFYWLRYQDESDTWQTIPDPLAHSVPFGAFAPAEFYDRDRLDRERADRDYFADLDAAPDPDGLPRIGPPTNILQLHINTASADGTLASLTQIYRTIAAKRQAGEPLTPDEQNYAGYDAIQLMPIEPTIEYEAGPRFWEVVDHDPASETVTVALRRPDMTNWGYDVVICASPAVNPAVLSSKRPDELVDFIATLHNFPQKPIKVILDVVYGHADNQALPLLNRHFFAGANMYGQNLNYRQPVVRAILLEMQRRKNNFGVDGVRVDGAQDFKYWDGDTQTLHHDDAYLQSMSDVVQEVAGQRYRPWMIFEDGRPWPQADWELTSTYREVTKQQPHVFQWGPLTFAHNTPFLFTFWISKWWRTREITQVGSRWITGWANHDTLRRGTQVDPEARINTRLGDSLPEILRNAYDHPAATILNYVGLPGVPMDFINASMRAPWSFIRNTDDRYGVKVVSEEARFLDWAVDEAQFEPRDTFPRLKELGFDNLMELRRFMGALDHVVKMTNYNLELMVELLQTMKPRLAGPPLSTGALKQIASAWMDDVHDYCNVSRYAHKLDAERTRFNLAVREFRRQRPWLLADLRPPPEEFFDHQRPCDGTVLYYGLRRAPNDNEQILFLVNMEGAPRTVTPTALPIPRLAKDGWRLVLAVPGLRLDGADQPVTLHNSDGAVFTRT